MKNDWISVEIKMPEPCTDVLCYCKSINCPTQNYVVGFFSDGVWQDGFFSHEHEVTHWMRLPEPPN